jgi:mRNA interferase MazF
MVIEINLDPTVGREIKESRPCVVIQNDIGNAHSSLTIVAAVTDAAPVPKLYPVSVFVPRGEGGLAKDGVVLLNQIRTVDEIRFGKIHGKLSAALMKEIDKALRISLSL